VGGQHQVVRARGDDGLAGADGFCHLLDDSGCGAGGGGQHGRPESAQRFA